MTLAALIILDDDRPIAPVLGLSWPEFQLRRAVRAGALHLVLVTARVGRDVVEAVDRLRGEGLPTSLARTTAEVADLFHPDEAVLLLSGSSIVADARLATLLAAPQRAILCVEGERAGAGHELIDARSHWTGIARLDGALIRATAAAAGEWDLGSMLLRKAVAARVARIVLSGDDLLADAGDPATMAAATRALIDYDGADARGWGARWIVAPLTGLCMRSFATTLPSLARIGPWLAAALFAFAPVIAWQNWTAAALAVFLMAVLTTHIGRRAAAATGIGVRGERLLPALRDAVGIVLLAIIAVPALPDTTPLVLASCIVAFMALADRLLGPETRAAPSWLADAPGHAAILLVASMAGPDALRAGVGLCALHGFVSLAFLQNRLSRVLTSPR